MTDQEFDIAIRESKLKHAQAAGFDTVEAHAAAVEANVAAAREESHRKLREQIEAANAAQASREAAVLAQAQAAGFATVQSWEAARQRQWAEADRKRKIHSSIASAGLPARQLEARAEPLTSEQQRVMDAILAMASMGAIAGLIGPRGTGKTHLAVKLVIAHVKATLATARYIKAMDYLRELKDTFDRDSKLSEREVVRTFTNYGLLVLDEAHERGGSDWELTQLTDLIDRRYSARRPTLLISNEKREAMAVSLGPSICSRLREDGDVFELAGESFRERIRAGEIPRIERPRPQPAPTDDGPLPFREDN